MVVVRLTLLPPINEMGLATVISPAVEFVKLTVRLVTKFAEELPKLNQEFETVPLLSLMRIEASPEG